MKKLLLIVFLFILCNSYTQNLVLNPSFENFSPRDSNQIFLFVCDIDNWFEPYSQPFCTDEYFNRNAPNTSTSWALAQQEIRTGDGMIAISVYRGPTDPSIYREYAETKLGTPLIKNINYCISYYVSLCSRAKFAIDALCACFSSDSLLTIPPDMLIHCNSCVLTCNSSIINDTINWVKISLNYQALGGEQYLTIGNFKTNNETNYLETNYPNFGELAETYYFIDDVAVYECNTPEYPANTGGNQCIEPGDTITLGSVQRAEYLYWWYDMQGNLLDTMATLTVNPTQTTSYILVQKDFKFDETRDTVTISVGNCLIDYSDVGFEIYPNPANDIVKVRFNSIVPEGSVMQIYDMIGRKVAEYPLKGTENIATVNLFDLATAIYHVTVVVPDGFRKSVKLVVMH